MCIPFLLPQKEMFENIYLWSVNHVKDGSILSTLVELRTWGYLGSLNANEPDDNPAHQQCEHWFATSASTTPPYSMHAPYF